ncbi:uncharacterized protein LOC107009802 [Solanum pennellii]|uniref:Uncharacterized protein LOC107009802 n=1 Tax=Solanum pennellii TaxID=28526 RepID=A0ABM1G1I8_SOLPN|nr:uncharacterized protein LOC107009802 [Solanum pennellii]
MGLTISDKVELDTYQLKDVAQTYYIQWRDNRPLRDGSVTWEIFKKAFIDRFFPWEKRDVKVKEFINFRQGVSDPTNKMRDFLTGVSDDSKEECHSSTLPDNMNISRFMVHAEQVEETREKPRFKKMFSNQVPSNFPKARDNRVSNPNPKEGTSTNSPTKKLPCENCGKKHYGDSPIRIDNFFSYGKSWHNVKDCPNFKVQDKGSGKDQASGLNVDVPKKNPF